MTEKFLANSVTSYTVDDLTSLARGLGLKGYSKLKKAELYALVQTEGTKTLEAQDGVYELEDTKPEPTTVVPNRAALRKMGQRSPKPKVTVIGKVMGLHHKGRALGLKHYQAMGLAIGRTEIPFKARRQAISLPNSERVQNYVRGNPLTYPKLTHNQWRRVRKNMIHTSSLSDVSPYPVRREVPAGYSKLAVTPDGRFNLLMQFAR